MGCVQKCDVRRHWVGQFRPSDVDYLCDRLSDFSRQNPRSTAFRYVDGVARERPAELWVDLHNLSSTMASSTRITTFRIGLRRLP